MPGQHIVNGQCCIGHKLAKDLVTCEKCGEVPSYPFGLHVNSRNKYALMAKHGMSWLPYTVEDWKNILSGNWDRNVYPWEREYAPQP
jgi:hypothetical protein